MWEKGVVVGIPPTGNVKFVCTPHDTVILQSDVPAGKDLDIGKCLEFRAVELPFYTNPFCSRRIVEIRECEQFLRWERQKRRNAALLVCNIQEVSLKFHPAAGKTVRCLHTDFLEEVYDTDIDYPRTFKYTDEQLRKMSVVAIRIVENEKKSDMWKVYDIVPKMGLIRDVIEHRMSGVILTHGTLKHGKDELYVWVPGRPRDVMLPVSLRKNISRQEFYGKWVSFSMNHPVFMDEKSDVQIIDDVLPTRYYSGRWEVRVPVEFNENSYDEGRRNLELDSEVCGTIVDCEDVLRKFGRLGSFEDQAWVHNFFYDPARNIRFLLSDRQEEWERARRQYFDDENRDDQKMDELEKVRNKVKSLKLEYNYFLEKNDSVPKDLMEELKDTVAQENRLIGVLKYDAPDDNDIDKERDRDRREISRREMATSEVKREELENCRKLVNLFRDMLAAPRVYQEMDRYDYKLLGNIKKRLAEL